MHAGGSGNPLAHLQEPSHTRTTSGEPQKYAWRLASLRHRTSARRNRLPDNGEEGREGGTMTSDVVFSTTSAPGGRPSPGPVVHSESFKRPRGSVRAHGGRKRPETSHHDLIATSGIWEGGRAGGQPERGKRGRGRERSTYGSIRSKSSSREFERNRVQHERLLKIPQTGVCT